VRKKDLRPGDPYYAAWHEYSRARRRAWILFPLLFWGGTALAFGIQDTWFPSEPWLVPVLMAPSVIAAIVVGHSGARWRCPRCHELFFAAGMVGNAFARRCMHCGLPKWAPKDPDGTSQRRPTVRGGVVFPLVVTFEDGESESYADERDLAAKLEDFDSAVDADCHVADALGRPVFLRLKVLRLVELRLASPMPPAET
jgi:hypothetical protein